MTTNPLFNAGAAALYIAFVTSILFNVERFADGPDNILIPFAMLSLFVLSAAVMAYIFFYQPMRLYLDTRNEEAGRLLIRTIGIFALITLSGFALVILLT